MTESAFPAALTEAFCIQEDRVVDWGRLRLQLQQSPLRAPFVKARVRVHEYPDGAPGGVPRPTLYRALQRSGRGDIRGPDLRKRDTMLAAVKAWPVEGRARGKRSATAIPDCGCARCHWANAGRDEETALRSNKETDLKEAGKHSVSCDLSDTKPGRPPLPNRCGQLNPEADN